MSKKVYVLKSVSKGGRDVDQDDANFERNLLNMSSLGIKWNTNLIRSMRGIGAEESGTADMNNATMNPGFELDSFRYHKNLAGHNEAIAFFDQSYAMRRDFLRQFALQCEIDYVIEMIANEVIVLDDMNYFAYPDTKNMKAVLKNEEGAAIIDDLNASYRRVYNAWHFNEGNDAWQWVKKLLIDGFLCFEILYKTDKKTNQATDIIGFQEIDPVTIQPTIQYDSDNNEYKVWVQYKGDTEKERTLLDSNVIYISWAKNNFISRLSYVEKLVRSFNMLRTLENSHIIWDIQNAQKRINIAVPMGTNSEQKMRTRLNELEAYYKEDIMIDNVSGELTVNGQPKFSFYKTYLTPIKNGEKVDISEIAVEGHNMNSIESLKYYWQRFIIETGIPKDRFSMIFDGSSSSAIPDQSNMTKEEYKFSLFVKRIRDIIQELVIKPTWIQFCLKRPNFATNNILRSTFGVKFIEENIFQREKERKIIESGANTISTLNNVKKMDGSPVFSTKFLLEKYMTLSEDEWKLNESYLKTEEIEMKKKKGNAQPQQDMGGGFGGTSPDMSGGFGGTSPDMSGGFGSDMGGGADGSDLGAFGGSGGIDTSGETNVESNFQSGGEV